MNDTNQALNLPNLLSVLRGVGLLVFVWAALTQRWGIAFGTFVYAVVSDLIDGPLARQQKTASALGTRLDHSADVLFTAGALLVFVWLDVYPWYLVVLQVIAFFEYTLAGTQNLSFKASYLGRINGILFFFAVGIPTTQYAFSLSWVSPNILSWFGIALAGSTLLSLLFRTFTRFRSPSH